MVSRYGFFGEHRKIAMKCLRQCFFFWFVRTDSITLSIKGVQCLEYVFFRCTLGNSKADGAVFPLISTKASVVIRVSFSCDVFRSSKESWSCRARKAITQSAIIIAQYFHVQSVNELICDWPHLERGTTLRHLCALARYAAIIVSWPALDTWHKYWSNKKNIEAPNSFGVTPYLIQKKLLYQKGRYLP